MKRKLGTEEFLRWVREQPDTTRYELVQGEPVAMAPERIEHARVKHRVARSLEDGIAEAGLPCEALPYGVGLTIDEHTLYEPDAMVVCGQEIDPDAVAVIDATVVVEVLSPSTRARDAGAKLAHELAHAVHVTWGCYAGSPYPSADVERFHSPSPEETGAWIVENMFRVERGLPARRTYLGDAPLLPGEMPSDRTTGIPLAAAERTAVAQLRRKAPSVAERLRALPARECPYNPFR